MMRGFGVASRLAALEFESMPAPVAAPGAARLGVLTVVGVPGRSFRYPFTSDDLIWTARFIVGEAGGRDDRENRAVIWAMFNRYTLFTHRYYKTFHSFLRAYSTPLQRSLKSAGAARRHMNKPTFQRTGGFYDPPNDAVPRGQLRQFLELQARPWSTLPAGARTLALQALQGSVPNVIGNASEFASTRVYFRDRHGRNPSVEEWKHFTNAFARKKNWTWIGDVPALDQMRNAFFVQPRAAKLPSGAVRVVTAGP